MTQEELKAQNIPTSDQAGKNKSIYDVSGLEVFYKNFIAGMGRAVGNLFIYLLIFVFLAYLLNRFLMPQILPLIKTLQNSIDTLQGINPNNSQNQLVDQILSRPELQNAINK